jgi:crotonobetainyl-CoA:carnitine CoA-transferase CaiB-like acyl-CoA transferase
MSRKPLEGMRVLDFTHAVAGPFATMFLGDLGAEIIKIERPEQGDGARTMGLPIAGLPRNHSEYHVAFNRRKQSVVLDLGSPRGVEIAKQLAAECDIVVQNFRHGVIDKLGLGFESLRKVRKNLVFCSVSAFGPSGPMADMPANDIIMQGVSGMMSITGEPGGNPVRVGSPISDFSTGAFALSAILAALLVRDQHPEGQHVEVSMLEATLNMMANYVPGILKMGQEIPRVGSGHAQIVPYQAFVCKDGHHVIVGAFTRRFWQKLCDAVGHPEWTDDAKFKSNAARIANRDVLVGMLSEIFRTKSRDEWIAILTGVDVPNSPLLALHETVRSDQVAALDSLITLGEGEAAVQVIRSPIRSTGWEETSAAPAPSLGADTRQVLQRVLGLSPAAVEALDVERAFGPAACD